MSTINVQKNDSESNESLIRRFTRKVQSSRKLIAVKQKQYRQPIKSRRLRRRSAILRAKVKQTNELLRKLGKKVDEPKDHKTKH
ncbi:MAG: hypothetical protein WCW27_05520 [Patescibacteria group bacterium]|jgi:ribosomal protein S21